MRGPEALIFYKLEDNVPFFISHIIEEFLHFLMSQHFSIVSPHCCRLLAHGFKWRLGHSSLCDFFKKNKRLLH